MSKQQKTENPMGAGKKPTMAKTHHNNGGGVFTSGRKRDLEPKMATKHPQRRRKAGANRTKRLANPGGRKIITKTAKNSSSTP
jgi:hypothetical protein